jgi:succinate dehydrogenase / fumarate reductase, flavoprotein subunit
MHLGTDVLVVGAGGAGMFAALAAAAEGARVVLIDKSMIGRGGATVMAQMTVAAALGEEESDNPELHFQDTLRAGRELCDPALSALLCEKAPARIRDLDSWGIGWARHDGHIRQVMAPGHSRKRCCYVDFLNTGPAVSATLRSRVNKQDGIRRLSNVAVIDLVVRDGEVRGAVAVDVMTAEPVTIAAASVVLAAGGLTKLYRRNSASANMAGESYGLALRAGAELLDMEFVQFFPIGHLAPRLVGMDPIMWDPFRYKLGGRLLNGMFEEFIERYGASDGGTYTAQRDQTTYAILKEVEAGRGSPAGGAYLSFQHVGGEELRAAFGPVIDRLARNGIDLQRMPVEVAPIAHYHMGGVRVGMDMQTCVGGLFAAGEAVGGANGANRLSGNAIPEALVFGAEAGRAAAKRRAGAWDASWARAPIERIRAALGRHANGPSPSALLAELQDVMWTAVGPFRTEAGLTRALTRLRAMQHDDLPRLAVPAAPHFNLSLVEWFELRNALMAAESIVLSALARHESRGAHQRDDAPETRTAFLGNHVVTAVDEALSATFVPLVHAQQGVA